MRSYKVIKRYKYHFLTVLTGENCQGYKVIRNFNKILQNNIYRSLYYNFITLFFKQKEYPLYFPLYNFFITYNGNKKEEKI
jgi:hypothetical protein